MVAFNGGGNAQIERENRGKQAPWGEGTVWSGQPT